MIAFARFMPIMPIPVHNVMSCHWLRSVLEPLQYAIDHYAGLSKVIVGIA
jgi:hypothetical protein